MTRWLLRAADPERSRALAGEVNISPIAAALLIARGVGTPAGVRDFFSPNLDSAADPFEMKGMDEAVGVLTRASRSGDRIVVFGDYDVDGVTAVAQLRAVLKCLGADSVPFLPHRIRDGYGLRPETLRRVMAEHHPRAIVTVDCGITAVEAVREAAEAGISVIITDHHIPPDELPAGAAVVNPKQPGCGYPFKDLCGAGVAFKIAQAIIRREKLALSERSLAKVAALGTVSDIVPLVSENRAIVAEGLAGLADPRAPGLKALLAEAGIVGRAPDAEEIAFRVGPRLNAAGRLDTADLALAVFEERDEARAIAIARELSVRNGERQAHERRVVEEARNKLTRDGDPADDSILIAAGSSWPRGVLGIAASRLAREFHRPVFLFSLDGGVAVGSGRSVPGVSLHGVLSEIRECFSEFGGHAQACGGTVSADGFDAFARRARALFAERVTPEQRVASVEVDSELDISQVNGELLAELERFEPYGEGNPRPRFLLRGVRSIGPLRPLGERGRRGSLLRAGHTCRAIAWGMNGRWDALANRTIDAIVMLRRDRYSGGPELEIVDLRESVA